MDNPSRITLLHIERLRGSGFLPHCIEVRFPQRHKTFDSPPQGWAAISTTHARCGALLPLVPFLQTLLPCLGICAALLTQYSYKMLACCCILWNVLDLGELTIEEFFYIFSIQQVLSSWRLYHFYSNEALVVDIPNVSKHWKGLWFYVRVACFGDSPLTWNEVTFPPEYVLNNTQENNVDWVKQLEAKYRNCCTLFENGNLAVSYFHDSMCLPFAQSPLGFLFLYQFSFLSFSFFFFIFYFLL